MSIIKSNTLKNIPFFKNCSDKTIEALSDQAQIIDLEKGSMLFSNKDKAERFLPCYQRLDQTIS